MIAGRTTTLTNANHEVVQVGYDSLNDITSLMDGLSHTTTWQYNQYGWLTNKVDGLSRNAFQFAYNANGWVTNRWTPEKGNTGYTYDNVGNLTSIIYPQLTISYAYNLLNELTNMVDAVGTTAFSYTSAGQLAGEDGPWADDAVNYTYSQGLRTALSLTQPGGSWSQSYGYDSMWRMTSLASPAGTFGYSYNFQPASTLVSGISLPNGASIANSYDNLARLTQTSLNNQWGHPLDAYSYQNDSLGLRTNVTRNLGLTSSSVNVGYDNINQLTSWLAKESGGTPRLNEQLGFGFDSADNLHSRTSGALSQTFSVDAANELTSVTRSGTFTLSGATPAPATGVTVNGNAAQTYGDFTFAATNNTLANGNNTFAIVAQNAYGVTVTNNLTMNLPASVSLSSDNNGNLTNDGTRAFAYDSENQLTNVTLAGQWKSDFVYDGLNRRRIERDYSWNGSSWVETNETRFIYDGYLLVQERDTNDNPLVTYTRGIDLSGSFQSGGIGGLLARTDADGSTFYHADGNGNITALMDGSENIVARYLYGPFGKLTGKWGSLADANVMRFSSKPSYHDIYDFDLRWYIPDLDRWLNQDPIGENGGINLYRFVANSPINLIDPLGLINCAALKATLENLFSHFQRDSNIQRNFLNGQQNALGELLAYQLESGAALTIGGEGFLAPALNSARIALTSRNIGYGVSLGVDLARSGSLAGGSLSTTATYATTAGGATLGPLGAKGLGEIATETSENLADRYTIEGVKDQLQATINELNADLNQQLANIHNLMSQYNANCLCH